MVVSPPFIIYVSYSFCLFCLFVVGVFLGGRRGRSTYCVFVVALFVFVLSPMHGVPVLSISGCPFDSLYCIVYQWLPFRFSLLYCLLVVALSILSTVLYISGCPFDSLYCIVYQWLPFRLSLPYICSLQDKLEDIIRVAHTFDQRANQDLQNNAQKGKIAQHIPQKGELR